MDAEYNNDNYLPLPIHSPVNQQVSLVDDELTSIEVARQIAERNKHKEDWDETFQVCDIGRILDQYKRWKKELPQVEVFYAVKANALRPVIRTMAALGCGFDCASKNEIALVLSCGVKPDKIIYAHLCKMISHLTYARDNDVRIMTFDNEEELLKIRKIFSTARLVLRLKTDDKKARTYFGNKFGASTEYAKLLLAKARELGLEVIGISFHVGSGCPDIQSYAKAIEDAKTLFDLSDTVFGQECGFYFKLLDLGGGFPGSGEENNESPFEEITHVIRKSLNRHFDAESDVKIIAEPGRFFPALSMALVTNVSAKKVTQDRMYYHVGDGVYNSFTGVAVENAKYNPIPLESKGEDFHLTTIYGVSCSGLDIVAKDILLEKVNIGDWLYWKDTGGYSTLTRFGFNGFTTYKACFFITKAKLNELKTYVTEPSFLPTTRNTI